jgi:hypothetical protein
MSHYTVIATQLMNKEILLKVLANMGFKTEEGQLELKGYQGKRTPVEIRVIMSAGYDLGFRRAKETSPYQMVADWWGVRGVKRDAFIQQLHHQYAMTTVLDNLEKQGFVVVSQEKEKNESTHLILRRTG